MSTLLRITVIFLLLTASGQAAALTVSHLTSDDDMLALLTDTLFVGEGRIGDGLGAATFEIDLGGDTGSPEVTAQYDWPNGTAVPWTLVYDHTTDQVTFTVDSEVLVWTSPLKGYTDIFVRARAVNAGSSILVGDLLLDSAAIGDQSHAIADATGLDILWIAGGSISDGFTLSGQTTMSWTGTRPTQSRLAFQIKVGLSKTVDAEDTSWGELKSIYSE
jgi:hypothetical protein